MKTLLALFVVALLCGCSRPAISNPGAGSTKWEYRTETEENNIHSARNEISTDKTLSFEKQMEKAGDMDRIGYISPQTVDLAKLGQDGWELVSAYTILETVSAPGITRATFDQRMPNTRTAKVIYIFKRPLK